MADLGGTFDATVVEPQTARKTIPAGRYPAAAIKSEWKTTANGKGRYLEFTFEVLSGEQRGARVASRLNLENQSQQAVEIARSELSAICHATGVMRPKDTMQLHNVPLTIKVKVETFIGKDGNEIPKNEIEGYESIQSASTLSAAPAESVASAEKAPWEK